MGSDTSAVGIAGLIVTIGAVVSMGGKFLFRLSLAQLLPAESFGSIALAISILNVGGMFYLMGMDKGVTKFISDSSQEDDNNVITTALVVVLVSSILLTITCLYFREELHHRLFSGVSQTYLYVTLATIPAFALLKLVGGILQGWMQAAKYTLLSKILLPIFLLVFGVTTALITDTGTLVAIAIFISYVVCAAAGIAFILKQGWRPVVELNTRNVNILRFSIPLMFSASTYILLMNTDKILIGYYTTTTNVGTYEVAFTISSLMSLFLTAFSFLVFPKVSELDSNGKQQRIQNLYLHMTKWITIFTTPLFVLLFFRPDFLISLFGDNYEKAEIALPLAILATGYYIHAIVGPNGELMLGFGRSKSILAYNVVALAINLLLNVLLIPSIGILGATIASLVSYSVMNVLKIIDIYINHNIIPLSRYGTLGLVCGILVGVPPALYIPNSAGLLVEGVISTGIAIMTIGTTIVVLQVAGGTDETDQELLANIINMVQPR